MNQHESNQTNVGQAPSRGFVDKGEDIWGLRGRANGASLSGEEDLRFIRNFHDIFLSIGLAMFALGLSLVTAMVMGTSGDFPTNPEEARRTAMTYSAAAFIDAAIMWVLAEVFARGRRLFLPAIVILIAYSLFTLTGIIFAYGATLDPGIFAQATDAEEIATRFKAAPLIIIGAQILFIFAYYLRTRLPFAMGAVGKTLAFWLIGVVWYFNPDLVINNFWLAILSAGLFLFVLGIAFDAQDPERKTRVSDNGFWLHFAAAPLIYFAVMNILVFPQLGNAAGTSAAVTTLLIVLSFALISVLINRRALLVSGLLSAVIAVGYLVSQSGLEGKWTAPVTLLLLGSSMVLLGGGWHTLRRWLVAPFPKSGPISRIVPPEPPKA